MEINIIAAVDTSFGLGYKDELLFRIPDDLKRFKRLTSGQVVIMGRKTFDSMGGKPLPNRINCILSNTLDKGDGLNTFVFKSREECLEYLIKYCPEKQIWVIGGGQIYEQFIDITDTIELTMVDMRAENIDTYFPEKLLQGGFDVVDGVNQICPKTALNYSFYTFKSNK